MKLQIAICDDEKTALTVEAEMLNAVLNEKQIEHSIDMFDSPSNLLQSCTMYNIVILDVEMDELNGIETAEKIRAQNKACLIFFVTNHEAYLDEAFNQHAFRFWTKPIDRHKLSYGLDSAIKELKNAMQFITITVNDEKIDVPIQNIIYMFAQNKKLHIITVRGEILSDDTFETIAYALRECQDFCEPHRSYLVNLKYVKDYERDKIFCSYNDRAYVVYLSRRKYGIFRRKFLEWLGGK